MKMFIGPLNFYVSIAITIILHHVRVRATFYATAKVVSVMYVSLIRLVKGQFENVCPLVNDKMIPYILS